MVGNHIFLSFVCSPEKKMGGGGEWWGVHMKDGESSEECFSSFLIPVSNRARGN